MRRAAHAGRRSLGPSPGRLDAAQSVLNGLVGDYLRRRANGLEIQMGLYHRNEPLACERRALARAHPRATGKLCVLVHGLAMNEEVWSVSGKGGPSYGARLRADLGYTPFYVRYNSGLHISENGRSLARLLTMLVRSYPVEVREMVLIGHSMGGLVLRSACELARTRRQGWLKRVAHVFYLGAPHLGAPLEKVGNTLAWALANVGVAQASLLADVAKLRSAGIKDLRHPHLSDEDWSGHDPDSLFGEVRPQVPLVRGIAHHFLVGALGDRPADVLTRVLGDGVVPVSSAAGPPKGRELRARTIKVFARVGHLGLAQNRDVYRFIRSCCAGEDPGVEGT